MNKLDENVKKLLNESKAWIMSTMDTTPNAVPILFKKMDNEDNLILFDVFMKKSIENIKKNSQIAITIYNDETLEGYQLKGTATYSIDSKLLEEGNSITSKINLTTKGAVIVNVKETFILTPGPNNGHIL
ncbi:pyridoxamine 5'-phosphate oxidase family protein [Clostridium ljungdahlii]|uniref:Pyridoxamine 5'-phosphate oxidase n=1 Tax=Clostridium ljungdahlii (strain ATCC 55383 / DSM 13528 / PETC) TaxID=748727 RepID=D8GTZ0_CLOLD|nr:pyridoxamine 5'-phosphate oxidase family protein [Clostridium ljungdahlii]ADK16803.1 hypothetical protein CLJU_c37770 [Clostridium ljungdahlii DSM 13528]OAA85657.1 Pyridoxamine 5'-phosphate oxidase [Clostridium ljungdahlii DSM 13528]